MEPMTTCRHEVVEKLAQAGFDGMLLHTHGTSSAEVLSAVFTMALRCVQFVQKTGTPEQRAANLQATRATLMRLLTETADESRAS